MSPFPGRSGAGPCLFSVLAPSERYHAARGRRHKTLTDWARQAILQTRRWLPDRKIVVLGDSSFSSLGLIAAIRSHVTFVTRLRLDAALYAPPPPRDPNRRGRPAVRGAKPPKLSEVLEDANTKWIELTMPYWYGGERCVLEAATGTAVWYSSGMPPAHIRWALVRDPAGERQTQAFLCTELEAMPEDILSWFVQRWSVETTFQESRQHIGLETQRQWSDLAIARTTPALLGLFSLITLWVADPILTGELRARNRRSGSAGFAAQKGEEAAALARAPRVAPLFNDIEFMFASRLTVPPNLATLQPQSEIFGTYHG